MAMLTTTQHQHQNKQLPSTTTNNHNTDDGNSNDEDDDDNDDNDYDSKGNESAHLCENARDHLRHQCGFGQSLLGAVSVKVEDDVVRPRDLHVQHTALEAAAHLGDNSGTVEHTPTSNEQKSKGD